MHKNGVRAVTVKAKSDGRTAGQILAEFKPQLKKMQESWQPGHTYAVAGHGLLSAREPASTYFLPTCDGDEPLSQTEIYWQSHALFCRLETSVLCLRAARLFDRRTTEGPRRDLPTDQINTPSGESSYSIARSHLR